MQRSIVISILALSFLFIPNPASAQQTAATPAPRPKELFTAKKIFISNASGENNPLYFDTPDQPYNQFYNAMRTWGKYELVTSPGDADLIYEIHFIESRPNTLPQLELTILDPESRITLWTLRETIATAARQVTGRKNFEKAMSTLVSDVQKLVSGDSSKK
ncbi:MAG: hypothetical protein ABR874_15435 [Candidatus Sulfotelmatobacter sp.]|jgi:hypothetical protein